MSCSTCDDLRRQLREAREEIEAWEAGARDDRHAWLSADRLARWRRVFGNARAGATVAMMMMVDKPDRLLTSPLLNAATRCIGGAKADDPGAKVASVHIHYARRLLKAAACPAVVHTSWGQGWFITAPDAALIRALVGDDT